MVWSKKDLSCLSYYIKALKWSEVYTRWIEGCQFMFLLISHVIHRNLQWILFLKNQPTFHQMVLTQVMLMFSLFVCTAFWESSYGFCSACATVRIILGYLPLAAKGGCNGGNATPWDIDFVNKSYSLFYRPSLYAYFRPIRYWAESAAA